MENVDALVQEGIAAIKAGRRDDAKRALMKAVELDEHSEQGWLWLSACVDSPEEQQICLENVLAINPGNQKARKGLDVILQAAGKPPSAAPPKPAAPPPPAPSRPDPFSGSFESNPFAASTPDFDSNPYAGTGFDSNPYGASSSDPAFGSASSVDWGHSANTGPAANGSGKSVDLPSSDQYDDWVSGLSLGGTASSSNVFDSGAPTSSSPFGGGFDSSFDSMPDPFGSSSANPFDMDLPADDSSIFEDDQPTSSAFSDFDLDDSNSNAFSSGFSSSPFGTSVDSEVDDPFSGPSSFGSTPKRGSTDDSLDDIFGKVPGGPKTSERIPGSGIFGGPSSVFGGSSAFGSSSFGDEPPRKASGPASGGFAFIDGDSSGSNEVGDLAYFKAIPPEIQSSAGGKTDIRLLATVAMLALLNVISLAFLVVNLTKH